MTDHEMPFRVGDEVVFTPDDRTVGWLQHAFERWGVFPGYTGKVTRIDGGQIQVDGKSECAMHYSQFRIAQLVTERQRTDLERSYRARIN